MTYVVYNTKSTLKVGTFETEAGAKRSVTCRNRKADRGFAVIDHYSYATEEDYKTKVVYKKKVINLISGNEIEIDSNTPACCDPSTETYWSM